ncbi:unnamed protein product [Dibothriocephalus latus]|uniref:Uncharacterized protein n=1 Tax=Dibothriocephalus latus TaxID=60516 RepID=A0A3P7MTE0_DIBLA|nr:unnamed protein product [Dibothriocephalus latus]
MFPIVMRNTRRLRCKREKKCRFESCAEQNQSNELQAKRKFPAHKPKATGDYCYYFYNDGNFVPIKIEARRKEVEEESKMMPLSPKAYLPAALSDWDFSKKEWTNGEAAAAAGEGMGSGSSGDKNPSKAARTAAAAPSSSAVQDGCEVEEGRSRNIPFRMRLKSARARFFGCFGAK